MGGTCAGSPGGHIEELEVETAVQSVPVGLVSALEEIALAASRASLFDAVGRALFRCTKARSVTVSLWNAEREGGGFFVEANFHDGVPWGFHLGEEVAPRALTHRLAARRLPLVRTQEPGEAPDPQWFAYPCFLGVPVGVSQEDPLPGTLVLGFMRRDAVTPEVVAQVQIVAQVFAGALARLGRYTDAIRAGQTLEREYILQQLHDSAVQDVFACEMAIAEALEEGVPPQTRGRLEDALLWARQANRNLRLILSGALNDEPNNPQLRTLVDFETAAHMAQGGAAVTVIVEEEVQLARPLYSTCKAMLHEALCNVRKHAEATNVLVMASIVGGTLLLSVEDDGVGMNAAAACGNPAADTAGLPHFGLRNLRRSVEACGGVLEIESEPGEGTLVRARLPLELGEPC